MKFVRAADIHLDSPLRGLESYDRAPVKQNRGAVRAAYEGLVKMCRDEDVSFPVLSGDIYDANRPDLNTRLFFERQMVLLGRIRVTVVVVHVIHRLDPNHDFYKCYP